MLGLLQRSGMCKLVINKKIKIKKNQEKKKEKKAKRFL
jgi:hypothetical protein